MKYICLVYQEEKNLKAMSDSELTQTVGEVGEWIDELERNGSHVFSSGLQAAHTATTLRLKNGEIAITDGPFAETKEVLGGFTIIEARDLNEALLQATKLASACRGTVEVRPQMDPFGDLTDPFDQKLGAAIRRSMETESTVAG